MLLFFLSLLLSPLLSLRLFLHPPMSSVAQNRNYVMDATPIEETKVAPVNATQVSAAPPNE